MSIPGRISIPPADGDAEADADVVLALDVGGTKTAAALVHRSGRLLRTFPDTSTPRGAGPLEDAIESYLRRLPSGRRCGRVAISMAGYIAADSSTVRLAPNLDLRDYPMGERLSGRLGCPVVVENDVNAAAWGEYRYGAGQGAAIMVLVMTGTGLGGGVVVNGALLRGANGFAGEFGHVRHRDDGPACGCGNIGCWEQFASSHALQRDRGERREGVSEEAAETAMYEAYGTELGLGLADLTTALDPSVLILNGGIANEFNRYASSMRSAMSSRLAGTRDLPRIAVSELGTAAPLLGVADLAILADLKD